VSLVVGTLIVPIVPLKLDGIPATGMTNIMASHSNNITEFNAEVMETPRKLQSRGPFHRYIENLENRHNDGDITLSTKSLMDKAETKYEELKDKAKFNNDIGLGNKEGEGEIMAMKAEIAKLKWRDAASSYRGRPSYHTNDWATTRPTDGCLEKVVVFRFTLKTHSPGAV
jgi:hypothetical protein